MLASVYLLLKLDVLDLQFLFALLNPVYYWIF